MKYYSEKQTKNLRRAFEEKILGWPRVSTKKMFGCPSYKAKSKLFAFLVTKGIVITHLTEADREKLSRRFHTTPFRAGKKTVHNWMRVSLVDKRDLTRIMPYVQRSYESVLRTVKKLKD